METKHLRVGSDGEALHVLHVALVLAMLRGVVHAALGEPAVGEGRGGLERNIGIGHWGGVGEGGWG